MRYVLFFFTYIIIISCNSIKKTATRNLGNQNKHYIFNDKISTLRQGKSVYLDNFSISYISNFTQDSAIKALPIAVKDLQYSIAIQDTIHKNIGYTIFISGTQLQIHKPILKGLINIDIEQTSTIEGFAQNNYDNADRINFYIRNYDNRSQSQASSEIVGNKFRMFIEPIINKKFSLLASNSTKTKLEGYTIGYSNTPICFIDITSGEVWISSFNVHDDVKAFLLGISTAIFLRD